MLAEKGVKHLDKKYRAHKLSSVCKGYWECHVKPDLLLIWEEKEKQMIIELVRTGSHSNLF
jgi:mRNA interferase YafQ